jgi:hypothetical protein
VSSTEKWLKLKVVLVSGRGEEFDPAPGRVMLVSANQSLSRLADAIDLAFARWDLGHLQMFTLPDGRQLMPPDEDAGVDTSDSTTGTRLASLRLENGSQFEYVFDLGDEWTHDCEVIEMGVDPIEEFGTRPQGPVPIDGWGWIPDQYGRDIEFPDDD